MHPKVQEKIDQLKAEEENKRKEIVRKEMRAQQQKTKHIKAQIPAAREWVESNLFDLIAKADLRIDKEAKYDNYNQRRHPKELLLHKWDNMIPNNIPIESIVKVIEEMDGLSIREEYVAEHDYKPSDDCWATAPAHYNYYVKW